METLRIRGVLGGILYGVVAADFVFHTSTSYIKA